MTPSPQDRAAADVVIAVRGGRQAKSRCEMRLTPGERERLVAAMLQDMLAAVSGWAQVGQVVVTTPTPALARLAAKAGAVVAGGPATPLNAAFAAALAERAAAGPERIVLFLPGDLPLIEAAELDAVLAEAGPGRVVVAPAAEGGTGAIAIPAGLAFPFGFGRDSFERHCATARSLGLDLRIVEARGLRFDVDEPADLDRVAQAAPGSRTAALLRAFERLPETGT